MITSSIQQCLNFGLKNIYMAETRSSHQNKPPSTADICLSCLKGVLSLKHEAKAYASGLQKLPQNIAEGCIILCSIVAEEKKM